MKKILLLSLLILPSLLLASTFNTNAPGVINLGGGYGTNAPGTTTATPVPLPQSGSYVGSFIGNGAGVTNLQAGVVHFAQPPEPYAVGRSLIPRLTTPASNNPPVFLSVGDSMGDMGGAFNGSAGYLYQKLSTKFGSAGDIMGGMNCNSHPTPWQRYQALMPAFMPWMTIGAVIYASDGADATSSYNDSGNLPVDKFGVWGCKWINGGILSVKVLSPTTNVSFTFDLHSTDAAADVALWHTNITVPAGPHAYMTYTSLSGSNILIGDDFICTTNGGIVHAQWQYGGRSIHDIIGSLSATSLYTLISAIKPDIALVQFRNNAGGSLVQNTQEFQRLVDTGRSAYTNVSFVFVYLPVNDPNSVWSDSAFNLAGSSMASARTVVEGDWNVSHFDTSRSPLWAIDLYTTMSYSTLGFGYDPHPTVNGGKAAADILYHKLGFDLY